MTFSTTRYKNYLLALLVLLTAIGLFRQKDLILLKQLILGVGFAVLLEAIFYYIKDKKLVVSSSAIISGLIICGVLAPHLKISLTLLAVAAAISSKYILRWHNRHIFNPANFGLFLAGIVFPYGFSWWQGSSTWTLIIIGTLIAFSMRNSGLILSYLLINCSLLCVYVTVYHLGLRQVLNLVNFYFLFIMLVEPKTSPITIKGKVAFGVLTAIFSFLFFVFVPKYDPNIMALVAADLCVPLINRTTKG